MRILIAHNRYQFAGGEDAVVRDETALLQRHGHEVVLFEEDNDSIHGIQGTLDVAASVFYSQRSRRRMRTAIEQHRPEIVHVHNWFPRLTPSIHLEAHRNGVPVVQTLHNYRMACANGLFFRDGRPCTDCLGKKFPLNGIVHACYRGSRLQSAAATAAQSFQRAAGMWDCVDLFIAVSETQRQLLVPAGIPAERSVVKPHFVDAEQHPRDPEGEPFALFAGRLSREKGLEMLLQTWATGEIPIKLLVLGDGPMRAEVEAFAAAHPHVEYGGPQQLEGVYRAMARARLTVAPSLSFETFGRSIVESLAQGTPVAASAIGAAAELIQDGVQGCFFQPGDQAGLIAAVQTLLNTEQSAMRQRCREHYEVRFSPEKNYGLLMDCYARAIERRSGS